MNTTEIKQKIRALKKIKKDCLVKTKRRRDINKQLRVLTTQLADNRYMPEEKKDLVEKIYKLSP